MTTPAVAAVVSPTVEGGEEFSKSYRAALTTVVTLATLIGEAIPAMSDGTPPKRVYLVPEDGDIRVTLDGTNATSTLGWPIWRQQGQVIAPTTNGAPDYSDFKLCSQSGSVNVSIVFAS